MEVNYEFVSESKSALVKRQSDIVSYAGKLLEIVGSRTLVVGLDNNNCPFVYKCPGRLENALYGDFDGE